VLFSESLEINTNCLPQSPILKVSLGIFLKQLNDVLIECVVIGVVRTELLSASHSAEMLLHVRAGRMNESGGKKNLMTMRFLRRFPNENQFPIGNFYL
jgi:hypothetical protein